MADQYPSIDPGTLRHQVEIQSQDSTQDAFGEQISTWTTVAYCYAAINELTGKEAYQAGQFTSQVTHTITIRGQSINIDATMQVLHGSQAYKIQSVNNIQQRNIVLKLMCLVINEGTNPQ